MASLVFVALLAVGHPDTAVAATAVPLNAASSFAVLGATPDVNNTGPTIVTGDLGVSPAAAVIGFPPGSVVGTIYAGTQPAALAQQSNTQAYGQLAAQTCDTPYIAPTELAGLTLVPGVYCFSESATNSGILTLDALGDPNAVWVFQVTSTFNTGSGSSISVINGGRDCNVFWQVGSSSTFGTTSSVVGNVLALTSITLQTGATLSGRALAQTGTVTLASSNVTSCSLALPPPEGTPALSKTFGPTLINQGGTSTLTITLTNPTLSTSTLVAPLVDTLPAGVVIAPLPNGSTTCGGGSTVTAIGGGNTVTLPSARTLPAVGSCTITVDVTAAVAGTYVNTLAIGALQTTNGNNAAPAIATLTVVPLVGPAPPALAKAFNLATIGVGGVSTLTITLANPNTSVATLSAAFTDTLPTGVLIAATPNASTTCGGGSTVTVTAGGGTVTLPAGRSIAANATCTIVVDVTAAAAGSYVNTLPVGALQTSNGNNLGPAVATLTVIGLVPVPPPDIPTLSGWGVLVMAMLLALLGAVMLRRRRTG